MPQQALSTDPPPEQSEDTIHRFLSVYELGAKLKHLRLKKKIGLVDLGKHTGLSASMLSQLENGKLTPTLPTLSRIAMVFDVGLDYFFGSQNRRLFAVVRARERLKFPERADVPDPAYYFENLTYPAQDKGMQAFLAEFPYREKAVVREHFHEGAEFIHVLEGALAIRYQEQDHELQAGDSVFFDSSEPHGYRCLSEEGAKALVVITAPRI